MRQLLRVRARRVWTVGLALLMAVAVIGVQPVSANATVAPMMAAATPAATGTAGLFVPVQGRLMDTRNGIGGYSTPMSANSWRTVTVAGAVGMPTTGISAVQLTVTAVTPTSQGAVNVQPTGSTPANVTCLVYGGTISGTTSSTTISAVGADGKIQVKADSSVNLLLDVQGYYTSGDSVAAGGYVPITPARLADTRNGTGCRWRSWPPLRPPRSK